MPLSGFRRRAEAESCRKIPDCVARRPPFAGARALWYHSISESSFEVRFWRHISRKELKTDEVRETFAHGAEAVLSHQQAMTYIMIVAIIVAVAVFGWKTYAERQTVKASAAFDDAMKTFQAPPWPRRAGRRCPGEPTFRMTRAKYTAAAPKFEDVAKRYPHTRPGQLANYYAGLCLVKRRNKMRKRSRGSGGASGSEVDFASMARFELAQLDDRTGQKRRSREDLSGD